MHKIKKINLLVLIPLLSLIILSIGVTYAIFTKTININKEVSIKTGTKYIGVYGENKDNIKLNKNYIFTIENRGVIYSGFELLVDSNVSIDLVNIKYSIEGDVASSGDLTTATLLKSVLGVGDSLTIKLTLTGTSTNYIGKLKIKYYDYNLKNVYAYTGNYQEFTAPISGTYKMEAWGAQGGTTVTDSTRNSVSTAGGKGAYTAGNLELKKGTKIYVYVGNTGTGGTGTKTAEYVYNGGGSTLHPETSYATGGGATDFRLASGTWNNFEGLKSRIMVAAGGGGAGNRGYDTVSAYGGSAGSPGGDLSSKDANSIFNINMTNLSNYGYTYGSGATQTSGGKTIKIAGAGNSGWVFNSTAKFGIGDSSTANNVVSSTGGGGYYGGGGGRHAGAAGGSSFISGYSGCNAISSASTETNIIHTSQANHYSGYIFTNIKMTNGASSMPTHDGTSTMTGNPGSGYAKISIIS